MKFKNKKKKVIKKAQPQKLPRNYRIIPEGISRDEATFFIGAICILVAILLVTFDLFSNLNQESKLANEKFALLKEQAFWQEEIKSHSGYRDAYFGLALSDYQLNNTVAAKQNLGKVLSLDPNFKEGRELEDLLNSR